MKRILTDIIRLFDEGLPVVLATIIDQDGSTTHTAGVRMIDRMWRRRHLRHYRRGTVGSPGDLPGP